jgi:hypothetical protein
MFHWEALSYISPTVAVSGAQDRPQDSKQLY